MAHVIGYIYTICHALTTKCRIVCTQIYPTILSIDSDLILATVYVPPEQSPYYNEDILSLMANDITDYYSKYPYTSILFNGVINEQQNCLFFRSLTLS